MSKDNSQLFDSISKEVSNEIETLAGAEKEVNRTNEALQASQKDYSQQIEAIANSIDSGPKLIKDKDYRAEQRDSAREKLAQGGSENQDDRINEGERAANAIADILEAIENMAKSMTAGHKVNQLKSHEQAATQGNKKIDKKIQKLTEKKAEQENGLKETKDWVKNLKDSDGKKFKVNPEHVKKLTQPYKNMIQKYDKEIKNIEAKKEKNNKQFVKDQGDPQVKKLITKNLEQNNPENNKKQQKKLAKSIKKLEGKIKPEVLEQINKAVKDNNDLTKNPSLTSETSNNPEKIQDNKQEAKKEKKSNKQQEKRDKKDKKSSKKKDKKEKVQTGNDAKSIDNEAKEAPDKEKTEKKGVLERLNDSKEVFEEMQPNIFRVLAQLIHPFLPEKKEPPPKTLFSSTAPDPKNTKDNQQENGADNKQDNGADNKQDNGADNKQDNATLLEASTPGEGSEYTITREDSDRLGNATNQLAENSSNDKTETLFKASNPSGPAITPQHEKQRSESDQQSNKHQQAPSHEEKQTPSTPNKPK
jgi:hypothetical protein